MGKFWTSGNFLEIIWANFGSACEKEVKRDPVSARLTRDPASARLTRDPVSARLGAEHKESFGSFREPLSEVIREGI